jgi:hypothetical protein
MIKRYFFINGIAHESKNGEWIKWRDAEKEYEKMQCQIDGLVKQLERPTEDIINEKPVYQRV